jgi:hypothetical protein
MEAAIEAARGTAIEVRQSLPPIDEYEPPAAYRKHTINDTASFIDYARRYGVKEKSLVFFAEDGCVLVIDEQIAAGVREGIAMPFRLSDDWQHWTARLAKAQTHRDLVVFLRQHEHNIEDASVLLAMGQLRMNATISIESDVRDEGDNLAIAVKTSGGEEMKRFPKKFMIRLPVLEQDLEPADLVEAEIALEIDMPTEPKETPRFTLWCSRWRQIRVERVRREGDVIREGLAGWTVLHGTASYATRTVGRPRDRDE